MPPPTPTRILAQTIILLCSGTGQVAALHALGPDYQSIFAPTDSNPLLEQTPAAAALLIHSKEALGPRLLLSYNAQAAAGRMLYNTADMDAAADTERDTAAAQEGSQLCCTCHLRDLLHCLGGVSVLLPLVRLPCCAAASSLVRR